MDVVMIQEDACLLFLFCLRIVHCADYATSLSFFREFLSNRRKSTG